MIQSVVVRVEVVLEDVDARENGGQGVGCYRVFFCMSNN
jgi:hypothetical protein